MLGFHLSKFVKEDVSSIVKHFRGRLLGISILIGFLLFLLNIFLGVGFYAHQFSDTMKDKLGMYFYIQESPGDEDALYKEVILMKEALESEGLSVSYSTKADALSFLEKKIPDVVDNFQKFGIDNPLPATLYVMFSNDREYDVMKTIVFEHKDIILNIKDIEGGDAIKQQENRILTTINFSNLLVVVSYCIIGVLLVIAFVFLTFLLKTIFYALHKEFEVKKLLGASHLDVTKSFVMITLNIILLAFLVCAILLLVSGTTLHIFLLSLFDLSLWDVLASALVLVFAFLGEVVLIGGASLLLAYWFTNMLHKKLHVL